MSASASTGAGTASQETAAAGVGSIAGAVGAAAPHRLPYKNHKIANSPIASSIAHRSVELRFI